MWAICEFAKTQIKKLYVNNEIDPIFKDKIEKEMCLLESISNDNKPDLSGEWEDVAKKFDWEEYTIVEIEEFNSILEKSIKYDRIKRALLD